MRPVPGGEGLIWPATGWDVGQLLSNMRQSDILEMEILCRAVGIHYDPEKHRQDILQQVAENRVWVMTIADEVACLGGVAPGNVIWMQGTDHGNRHWREMTRKTRRFMEILREKHGFVQNCVPKILKARIRWLRHLGFDFIENEAQLLNRGLVAFVSHRPDGPEG